MGKSGKFPLNATSLRDRTGLRSVLTDPADRPWTRAQGSSVGEKPSPNAADHTHQPGKGEIEPEMVVGSSQTFSHRAAH